jgi:hypothetical protein
MLTFWAPMFGLVWLRWMTIPKIEKRYREELDDRGFVIEEHAIKIDRLTRELRASREEKVEAES